MILNIEIKLDDYEIEQLWTLSDYVKELDFEKYSQMIDYIEANE